MTTAHELHARFTMVATDDAENMIHLAKAGYATVGRGAILVSEADSPGAAFDARYATRGEVVQILDEGGAGDEAVHHMWNHMAFYETESEIVVAFLGSDGPLFETMIPRPASDEAEASTTPTD